MVDSDKPEYDSLESDDKLTELYRASREKEVEIPPGLDASILEQARSEIASSMESEHKPAAEVVRLRKRWEIPASIAATFVIATLLFIQNKDDLPAVIDMGIPESDQNEISRPSDTGMLLEEIDIAEESKQNHQDSLSTQASPRQPAPGMSKAEPQPTEAASESRKSFKRERQSLSAPARFESLPMPPDSSPSIAPPMTPSMAPSPSPTMQTAPMMEKSISAETEAQPIDPQSWLSHIQNLAKQGLIKQAQTELIAFKVHFPDYSLQEFCEGHESLCKIDNTVK